MASEHDESLSVFLSDAEEAIRTVEESLLVISAGDGEPEHIHLLYRSLHTLKGNAAFLVLTAIEKLAHACEDLASLPRDTGVPVDAGMSQLLLEALDLLRAMVVTLSTERRVLGVDTVAGLIARLDDAFITRGGVHEAQLERGKIFLIDDALGLVDIEAPEGATEDGGAGLIADDVPVVTPPPSAPTPDKKKAERTRDGTGERREFLRVDAAKVAALMDLAGELGLACAAVSARTGEAAEADEELGSATHRLELLIRELQNDLSSLRLVPVSPVFERMRRVVADAARRTEKDVEIVVRGEDTEVDKVMIDALQDPLVHVLRNAVDHGIESPSERVAAGKKPTGRILLSATQQGGEVIVEVRDDGRGLSRERVLARAIERGLCAPDAQPSDEELAEFVFLPGFSTKDAVDSLSGRGVGMDVLKTTVERLRGHVRLESVPGAGSRVVLRLPLTLAFVEAMVVREQNRLFALPIEKVFEVSRLDPSRVVSNTADQQLMLRVRDTCVPVLWLHRYWGENDAAEACTEGKVVVVVQGARGILAVPVDELVGNQQVMLKPLHGPLAHIRAAAGCGMLRSGEVAITLDCDRLHA